jgi:hypothetical protein
MKRSAEEILLDKVLTFMTLKKVPGLKFPTREGWILFKLDVLGFESEFFRFPMNILETQYLEEKVRFEEYEKMLKQGWEFRRKVLYVVFCAACIMCAVGFIFF